MKRRYTQISNMKVLKAADLRDATDPLFVTKHGDTIAVIVPYALFQKWQSDRIKAVEMLEGLR